MDRARARAVPPATPARAAARVAGYAYLAIFVLAIFANFFVVSRLVEPGDAPATAANIAGSEGLFRAGLVAFTIVFALDVLVAWALYVFFRDTHPDLSLVTAWFRLVYTIMLGVGLVFFFLVLQLVTAPEFQGVRDDGRVLLFLDGFDFAWLIGLVCFGVHLILLANLGLRSRMVRGSSPIS